MPSETEDDNGERDHESIEKDQEPEMKSPIPLKLPHITLRRLLVRHFKISDSSGGGDLVVIHGGSSNGLDESELLRGEAESELVTTTLVLKSVDAAEGLSDGDVEDEVREREEANGSPRMAALETARGLRERSEDDGEEDEEEVE